MFGRSDPSGQWSVYAEFTISHPGVSDPENIPVTHTEQNDNKVRMTYSWNSQRNSANQKNTWTTPGNLPSEATSNSPTFPDSKFGESRSTFTEQSADFGFQKGNLLFTSTPPLRRPFHLVSNSSRLNAPESSGYGSNILSPNSLPSSTNIHHDERRCRSTCNVTLCTNPLPGEACHHHCGRTQSLRCQTPSSQSDYKNVYYGCGDPWCHHLRSGDDNSMGGRCSPVLETCEECPSLSGRSHKATRSLSRELDNRKDVSVQTFEMVDKCTSPFLDVEEKPTTIKQRGKVAKKVRRRSLSHHLKTEPIHQRSNSPSSFTPDSLDSVRYQPTRRLTRSPKLKRMPHVKAVNSETTTASADDKSSGSKKPRTVHIDVYCTGTEVESDSSNSNFSDNDTASTPQTVFESKQMKITHKRADGNSLPMNIGGGSETKSSQNTEVPSKLEQHQTNKSDSDGDDSLSTAYPSKRSSLSTFKDFTSSISSVPRSWTNYSMSSCAIPDMDYDSLANTSWKDNTYSDLDSALQSRSSITGTDSLLFVPRKLQDKSYSIDEGPELTNTDESKSPSAMSLQLSDSFEYANSEDKMRIKRMEAMWQKEGKTPITEKIESKHRKQERRMNEYLQKKLKHLAKKESKESDSDDSADSGKGWTFVKKHNETKKDGSRTVDKLALKDLEVQEAGKNIKEESNAKREKSQPRKLSASKTPLLVDQGSLSDSSPSPTLRTPSTTALIQRLSLNPSLRAPFTLAPGQYTEQRNIAKKFGAVVSAFKKPGHHIGPVRNPECNCAHCLRYYETVGFRSRTRSVGDPPSINWGDLLNNKL